MDARHAIGEVAASRMATILKAVADPLRLRTLSLITSSPTGEVCVCDVTDLTEVSGPTVSHHLKVLRDVGVLTSERRGTWVYYSIVPAFRPAVTTLLDAFGPAVAGDDAAGVVPPDGLTDVDGVLTRIGGELAERFDSLPAATVLAVVRDSYTALARRPGVRTHLVVAAERFARQRLADMVVAAGDLAAPGHVAGPGHAAESGNAAGLGQRPESTRPPQVLFVCVANAGRSQLAAALLQRYAGDGVVVRSAGSSPAGAVQAAVQAELDSLGIDTDPGRVFPKPLTDDAVRAADVVITMGCGDTCPVLPGKRYEDWAVGDPALASPAGVAAIRAEIEARVKALAAELVPTSTRPTTGS